MRGVGVRWTSWESSRRAKQYEPTPLLFHKHKICWPSTKYGLTQRGIGLTTSSLMDQSIAFQTKFNFPELEMVYLINKQNGVVIASRWNIQPTVVWTFFVCLQIRVINTCFKSIKMQMNDDTTRSNKLGYTAELVQPMEQGPKHRLKGLCSFRRHEIS